MTALQRQAILLFSALTGMGVSLASTVIAGRYADDAAFALCALVATFLAIARDLTDLGTTAVAVRAATHDPAAERRALEDLLTWRMVASLPLAVVCLGFALVQAGSVRFVLVTAAAAIVAVHSNGLIAMFQLRHRLDRPALAQIIVQLATLAATISVAGLGLPGRLLAIILIARELLIVTINRRMVLRRLGYLPRLHGGGSRLRALLGATSLYAGAALLFHFALNSGTFVVRLLTIDATFNPYAAAFRLTTPVFGLTWFMTAPLMPLFARAALSGSAALERQAGGALICAFGGSAVLATAGAMLAPDLLRLVYGGRFADGAASATTALRLLMPALCGVALAAVRAPAMLAVEAEIMLFHLAAAATGIALIGQFVLIPLFGAGGGAAAIAFGILMAGLAPYGPRAAQVPFGAIPVVVAPALSVAFVLWLVPLASVSLRVLWGTALSGGALLVLWHLPPVGRARADLARANPVPSRA